MRALRLGLISITLALVEACTCDRPQFPCSTDVQCPDTYSCVAGACAKCPACADTEHCAAGACVPNQNPNRLVFTTAPQTVPAGGCSGAVTVAAQDQTGAASPPAADLLVSLSATSSTMTFFTDDTCTAAVGTVTLGAGANDVTFHFLDAAAGTPELTASATGYDPAKQTQTVTAGAVTKLAITTAAQLVAAGACSAAVTVTAQDALNNAAPVAADATVDLTSDSPTLAFFADPGCGTPVTSLVLAAGMSSRDFFFRDTVVGTPQVTAAAPFGNASQVETITPAPATALAFTTPARTILSGGCSGVLTVQVQDTLGNPSVGTNALMVALTSSSPTLVFHQEATCTSPMTSVTVPAGGSSASFYFTDSTAGIPSVTASAMGLNPAVQNQTVNASSGKLAFISGAQTRSAGACSGVVTVQAQTPAGMPQAVTAPTTVSLSSSSPTLGFFSDAMCTMAVTSVTIAAGTDQAGFHFLDTAVGGPSVTVDAMSFGSATQVETIIAGAPTSLVFTTPAQMRAVGACSGAVTVEVRDAFNNPARVAASTALMLASSSPTMTFHGDAACGAPAVTGVSIAGGMSTAQFYFKDTQAGGPTVTVSGSGLGMVTQAETIIGGGAAKLVFTSTALTTAAGTCSAPLTVQSQDAFSNPVALTATATVMLSATGSTTLRFFADTDTNCNAPLTTISIMAGMSLGSFRIRDTRSGMPIVTAASAPLQAATQQESFVPGAPDRLVFVNAPLTVPDSSCSSAATLQVQDANGNATNVTAAAVVTLTSSSTTLQFFPDAACGVATTTVTVPIGSNQVGFYFRDTAAGTPMITAASAPLTSATQTETITMVSKRLQFTTPAQTLTAGACSAAVTIQSQTAAGAPLAVGAATGVALNAVPSNVQLFTDMGCATALVGTPTIAAGSSTVTFFFKEATAGSLIFAPSSAGYGSMAQTETINPGPVTKIGFANAPVTIAVNGCATLTVESEDAFGNFVKVNTNTTVNLTASSGAIYSNSGCTTVLTSTSFTSGQSSRVIYFKDTVVGMPVVTGTATVGLMPGSQTETVTAGPATKVAITTAPKTLPAGTCSSAATVTLQDAFGNAAPAASATVVNLASPSMTLQFFSDSGCSTAVSAVTVAQGTASADFFFRDTKVGMPAVNATSTPLTGASQLESIIAAPPKKLVFLTAPQSVLAGSCSPVTLQVQDPFNNPSAVTASTVINLMGDTTSVRLHTDACVSAPVTQLTLNAGSSTVQFWFRETKSGGTTLNVNATGLDPAAQLETITPAAPGKVAFVTAQVTVKENVCTPSPVTLEVQDQFNNPSPVTAMLNIGLSSSSPSMVFYAVAGCTTNVTSVTVAAGTTRVSFWFRDTTVGTPMITATSSLGTVSQLEVIDPALPTKLAFTTPARSAQAGVCSAVVTIQSQNMNGIASAVVSDTSVTLMGPSGFTFFTDASCATTPVNSVVITAGTNSKSFYFKDTTVGSRTVTISSATLTGATQSESITPGLANRLVFVGLPGSISAGGCSTAATVQVRDAFGNDTTVTANTTVALASTPAGLGFFSDTSCNTSSTMPLLAAGTGSLTFRVKSDTANSYNVTATASGLTQAAQSVQVSPGTASVLVFSTPQQTVAAGACSSTATLRTQDALGNSSNVAAATPVTLTAPNVTFYSDACTNVATQVSVPAGSSTVSFWFKSTVSGPVTVNAAATAFTSANQLETITAGAPSKLVFLTTPPASLLASSCSGALTVQSQDAFSNPTIAPLTIDLTAGGSPELIAGTTFYTDATCTTAVTQLAIASMQNQATFYFKALAGGALTVTASSTGLTSAMQSFTVRPTVRTGSCAIGNGSLSQTCTIPAPAVGSLLTTMMMFQASSNSSAGGDTNVRCFMNGTSSIFCDRASTSGVANIQWQLAEFPTGTVTVRHAQAACGGNLTTIAFSPMADGTKSFVLFSSTRSSGTAQTAQSTRTAKLNGSTSVVVEHNSGGCSGDAFAVQVVEWPNAVVSTGTTTFNALSATVAAGAVDTTRTFLLYNWRMGTGTGCERQLRGALGATSVTFTRGNGNTGCTGTPVDEVFFQRVQLPVGNRVQAATVSLTALNATGTATLPQAVDTSRSIVFSGGQITSGQAGGETSLGTGEVFGEALGRHALVDPTTVRVTRDASQGASLFGAFVVELRP